MEQSPTQAIKPFHGLQISKETSMIRSKYVNSVTMSQTPKNAQLSCTIST